MAKHVLSYQFSVSKEPGDAPLRAFPHLKGLYQNALNPLCIPGTGVTAGAQEKAGQLSPAAVELCTPKGRWQSLHHQPSRDSLGE